MFFHLRCHPLEKDQKDIELYTRLFVKELQGDKAFSIDQEVIDVFKKHPWKRNVRELKDTIERAITYSSGRNINVAAVETPSNAEEATSSVQKTFSPQEIIDALKKQMEIVHKQPKTRR